MPELWSKDGCGMKPKPFEIIVEFTPQSTKTGITYEAHQKGSLIRCEDCKHCTETGFYNGTRWNYCSEFRRVMKENDFCSWAEPKGDKDDR